MNWKVLFRRFLWIACRTWLTAGLCSLGVALGFGIHNGTLLLRSIVAKGAVLILEPVRDQEGNTFNYAPVFTFNAVDGRSYTVKSAIATNPPESAVGDRVRVLYVKSDPEGARLANFWQFWFVPVLLAALGLFFTGAGYGLLLYERRAWQCESNSTYRAVLARN